MIDLVFCEINRPRPDLEHFASFFPGAAISYKTEKDLPPIFSGDGYGNHMHDYYQLRHLLESQSDVAIAFDADLRIVSPDVKALPLFAERFGMALPANPRMLVRVDTLIGAYSDRELDETNGTGYAVNNGVLAFSTRHTAARRTLEAAAGIIRRSAIRAPLALWRACWQTGFSPYLLPPQWCVCQEHVGIGNEIILHVGHEKVARYYAAGRSS
jgi:DNA-binding transcriptional LysR family regulator